MKITIAIAILAILIIFASSVNTIAQPALSGTPRAQKIRSELQSILSSPEYRPQVSKPGLLERFSDWLDRLFKRNKRQNSELSGMDMGGAGIVLYWIVIAALVVGLAFMLAWLVKHLGGKAPAIKKPKAITTSVVEIADPVSNDPEDWIAVARRAAEQEDYRRAYRAVFQALLLNLDRSGIIRYDRARTNGEYVRLLRKNPPYHKFVMPLAMDFDLRWYGGAEVREEDYRRATRAYETLAMHSPQTDAGVGGASPQ